MSIELPQSESPYLPKIPVSVQKDTPELFDFLEKLRSRVEDIQNGLFDNDRMIANAVNSGTSGTFTISSGGSIVVTSGIVISVTS